MSAAGQGDTARLYLRLKAAEDLLREVITDLTAKAEVIGGLQLQVKALETWRDARKAMDSHVLVHLRDGHNPRDTQDEYLCWVCLPYLIPAEVRALLSTDQTREF